MVWNQFSFIFLLMFKLLNDKSVEVISQGCFNANSQCQFKKHTNSVFYHIYLGK